MRVEYRRDRGVLPAPIARGITLPLTMGHENVGDVVAMGHARNGAQRSEEWSVVAPPRPH